MTRIRTNDTPRQKPRGHGTDDESPTIRENDIDAGPVERVRIFPANPDGYQRVEYLGADGGVVRILERAAYRVRNNTNDDGTYSVGAAVGRVAK